MGAHRAGALSEALRGQQWSTRDLPFISIRELRCRSWLSFGRLLILRLGQNLSASGVAPLRCAGHGILFSAVQVGSVESTRVALAVAKIQGRPAPAGCRGPAGRTAQRSVRHMLALLSWHTIGSR